MATIDSTQLSATALYLPTLSFTTAFLSGLYNVNTGTNLTPYFGAGVGYSLNSSVATQGLSLELQGAIAWQLQGGAKYSVSNNISLFTSISYRSYAQSAFVNSSLAYGNIGANFMAVTGGFQYNF